MEDNSKELHITYSAIPTYENVSYAFERLITPITIATSFEPYRDSWEQFKVVLNIVKKWVIIYDKTKDLTKIDMKELKKVDDILYELDGKYLSTEGLYAENAYIWLGQIQILIKKTLNERDGVNGL